MSETNTRSLWRDILKIFQERANRPENGIKKVDGKLRKYTVRNLQNKWDRIQEESSRKAAKEYNRAIEKIGAIPGGKQAGSAKNKKRKKSAKDDVLLDVDEVAKKKKRKTFSHYSSSDVDADERAKKKKRKTFSQDSVSKVGVNKETGVGVDVGTEDKRVKKERAEEKKQRNEGKLEKEREKSRKE